MGLLDSLFGGSSTGKRTKSGSSDRSQRAAENKRRHREQQAERAAERRRLQAEKQAQQRAEKKTENKRLQREQQALDKAARDQARTEQAAEKRRLQREQQDLARAARAAENKRRHAEQQALAKAARDQARTEQAALARAERAAENKRLFSELRRRPSERKSRGQQQHPGVDQHPFSGHVAPDEKNRRSSKSSKASQAGRVAPTLTKVQRHVKYSHSQQWQAQRAKVIERDQSQCQHCGKHGNRGTLQVHHLKYTIRGQEPLEDLILLCGGCHKAVHGL